MESKKEMKSDKAEHWNNSTRVNTDMMMMDGRARPEKDDDDKRNVCVGFRAMKCGFTYVFVCFVDVLNVGGRQGRTCKEQT